MVTEQKKSGSYYTPEILSDFLVKHVFSNYILPLGKEYVSILEPSCGDGKFIEPIFRNNFPCHFKEMYFEIRDTNKRELYKAGKLFDQSKSRSIKTKMSSKDFLFSKTDFDFDLVLGNPPYISKKHLKAEQIEKCKEICNKNIPKLGEVKNIWTSFLLKSINSLKEGGILCFVLPSELLQVNYTEKIRKYLLDAFSTIEIFAFNELIFPDIEQDVIVLIGKKRKQSELQRISFYQVNMLEDLKIPDYVKKHSNVHRKKLDKWTNYILKDSELNLIEKVLAKNGLKSIKECCLKAEVGIVTAANDFFILSKTETNKHKLNYYSKPIIKKGSIVKNMLELKDEDVAFYQNENLPINFIHFRNKPFNKIGKHAQAYILKGEAIGLNKRYKMKLRENWFHIPSIWYGEGLFMKRSHLFPRMIVTSSQVLATDSFYRIITKGGYKIKNLTFSFYNTLTFILAELEGRFYGGGVLELTPSEFKNLMIPYQKNITSNQFKKLDRLFRNRKEIEQVLDYTDSILLPDISESELNKLRGIWKKLLYRRLKK